MILAFLGVCAAPHCRPSSGPRGSRQFAPRIGIGRFLQIAALATVWLASSSIPAAACTGITLESSDGGVVVARTNEWGLGDMNLQIGIFPRGHEFRALTPEGAIGMRWTGRYGFVSMTAYGQPYGPDGMNEEGLSVGMFYLPGYADYLPWDPALAGRSMSVGDLMQWMLSSFATVAEVREHLDDVRVVHVDDPSFGGAPLPFHWKLTDPSGDSLILEYVRGGERTLFEPVLGVVTNAPTYDWHLTNLNNYLNLSPAPSVPLVIDGRRFAPFGAGSGMIGLPGDFSPASRFVRATALVATARPLASTAEAVDEAFRILDSFNIPLGAVLPPDALPTDIVGSTQITSASDLVRRTYSFHTQFNRRVRSLDLAAIDFATVSHQFLPADRVREQDVEWLTARP